MIYCDFLYLAAGQCTQADLTAATRLLGLSWPPERNFDWPELSRVPTELIAIRDRLKSRPVFGWAQPLYRTHRPAVSG